MMKACQAPHDRRDPVFILSSLFYGAFEQESAEHAGFLLRRLKYDNRTISSVKKVLNAADLLKTPTQRNIRCACHLYGVKAAELALSMLSLDHCHQNKGNIDSSLIDELRALRISGTDLIRSGIDEGREIGIILSLLNLCLYEKPQLNHTDILLLLSEEFRKKLHGNNLL